METFLQYAIVLNSKRYIYITWLARRALPNMICLNVTCRILFVNVVCLQLRTVLTVLRKIFITFHHRLKNLVVLKAKIIVCYYRIIWTIYIALNVLSNSTCSKCNLICYHNHKITNDHSYWVHCVLFYNQSFRPSTLFFVGEIGT